MDANRLQDLCKRFGLEAVEGLVHPVDGRPIVAMDKEILVFKRGKRVNVYYTEDDLLEWEAKAKPWAEVQAAKIAESEASKRLFMDTVERVLKKFGPKDFKVGAYE
jgi:hypothetical protein